MKLLFSLPLFFVFSSLSYAQTKLDSVQQVHHYTYHYQQDKEELSKYRHSTYDTNQILVLQDRYHYFVVDTGRATSLHYHLEYDPRYLTGSYYTENLPHESKPNREYTKYLTKFRASSNNPENRVSTKNYKANSTELLSQKENKFDERGNMTQTIITDYRTNPPTKYTENVKRNAAGNMIQWQSFDEDGDSKKMQARNFVASYRADTLLVQSTGYVYNNWKQTTNKYSGKNELKKSVQYIGSRAPNGKIKKLDQNSTTYKNNRPYKRIEKQLNRKVKTILYSYEAGKEIQQVTTPTGSYTEVMDSVFLSDTLLLSTYTETKEGKPFMKIEMQYDTNYQVREHTEIEYRKNAKDWKTVQRFDANGYLTEKLFYIADELNKKETYTYVFFEPKAKEEED